MAKAKRTRCLCGQCDGKVYARGLSRACYEQAKRFIAAGRITEEQAIAKRLILPASRGGRVKGHWTRKAEAAIGA